MFSKFKKVLVSLALAASLALAPMNVSADYNGPIKGSGSASVNPAVNQNGDTVQVPVYLTGSASVTPEYVVEVSPSITIDLDNNATSASNLDGATGSGGVYLKLTKADDFGDQSLQITPSFAISTGDPEITMYSVEDSSATKNKTLSALGVTNDLLKFGTYTDGELSEGSDATTFAETETNTPKSVAATVAATVDATTSAAIRKNIPDEIGGKGDVHIRADQRIGNVTFNCQFVS